MNLFFYYVLVANLIRSSWTLAITDRPHLERNPSKTLFSFSIFKNSVLVSIAMLSAYFLNFFPQYFSSS